MSARSVALNTVSGDRYHNITADRVGSQAISGTITFHGDLQPNSRYEFTSHSGGIRLAIPPSSLVQIEASSPAGRSIRAIRSPWNSRPRAPRRGLRGAGAEAQPSTSRRFWLDHITETEEQAPPTFCVGFPTSWADSITPAKS